MSIHGCTHTHTHIFQMGLENLHKGSNILVNNDFHEKDIIIMAPLQPESVLMTHASVPIKGHADTHEEAKLVSQGHNAFGDSGDIHTQLLLRTIMWSMVSLQLGI